MIYNKWDTRRHNLPQTNRSQKDYSKAHKKSSGEQIQKDNSKANYTQAIRFKWNGKIEKTKAIFSTHQQPIVFKAPQSILAFSAQQSFTFFSSALRAFGFQNCHPIHFLWRFLKADDPVSEMAAEMNSISPRNTFARKLR